MFNGNIFCCEEKCEEVKQVMPDVIGFYFLLMDLNIAREIRNSKCHLLIVTLNAFLRRFGSFHVKNKNTITRAILN
jgi:hypothetical protein